jgi:hypothetical protein
MPHLFNKLITTIYYLIEVIMLVDDQLSTNLSTNRLNIRGVNKTVCHH